MNGTGSRFFPEHARVTLSATRSILRQQCDKTSSELERASQRMITIQGFRALKTTEGRRLLNELRDLEPADARAVAVTARLRRRFPPELVAPALTLHDLRGRARDKFTRSGELWLTRDGLEQATSESIAEWRARRFRHVQQVADLCCGIGGDMIGLARRSAGGSVLAVDRDPLHLMMAQANAEVYGVRGRVEFREADVRDVDLSGCEGVFIDPARRSGEGRLPTGQSEPPLGWSVALGDRIASVGIKAAPGISRDLVPDGWELEMIALGADLKEAVLWSPSVARASASATVIRDDAVHHLGAVPGDPVPARIPEASEVLLDPNPAVTRAGLVEDLARRAGADKLDDQLAFLVAAAGATTPFARSLPIVASLPWHEKRVRARLRELDAGPVDVRRRGLAGDVDAIAKRLRGHGSRPFTLAMTRVRERPWAIICEDPERA